MRTFLLRRTHKCERAASVVQATYFLSTMVAREGRQGSARVARKGGREL